MFCALYIISAPDYEIVGKFKVGIHSGEIAKLITRYITSHPDLSIKLFIMLPDGKAREIENKIKSQFAEHSVSNINGNSSEWFQIPLETLQNFIFSALNNNTLGKTENSTKIISKLDSYQPLSDQVIDTRENTLEINSQPYCCKYCGKMFAAKKGLDRHQLTAKYCAKKRNEKIDIKFECQYCEYKTCFKSDLNKHVDKCIIKNKDAVNERKFAQLEREMLIKEAKIEILEKVINRPCININNTNSITNITS